MTLENNDLNIKAKISFLCLWQKLRFLVERDVRRSQKVAIVCGVESHKVKLVIWVGFRANKPYYAKEDVITECRKTSYGY